MPFQIVRQDITKMPVDAIVNAANTQLKQGGGVCGAIFAAAGAEQLQTACDQLAPIKVGEAVITPGFALPARFIIHAAGPVYQDGQHGEEAQLRASYRNALKRAVENRCRSVAFPLIASGIYGYPHPEALQVAFDEIKSFLEAIATDLAVTLVVFDRSSFAVSEQLLGPVQSFIDEHYVRERTDSRRSRRQLDVECQMLEKADYSDDFCNLNAPIVVKSLSQSMPDGGLDALVGHLDEPFSATLLRLIDAKGQTDMAVYKRANIDRKLFSKIRSSKGYMPGKRTAIALAVALELTLPETDDLLRRAGYALSRSQKFDVIVEYFIRNGQYDIFSINQVLFSYDLPLLGG